MYQVYRDNNVIRVAPAGPETAIIITNTPLANDAEVIAYATTLNEQNGIQ